ncbi:uncharacterized protein LOC135499513 [Lineus longissimus]|uniref:uncharacterized protein LOC135499513 n=1 Tax=Lineus longissimus TaxID=88925 RepID=UPI00315D3C1B
MTNYSHVYTQGCHHVAFKTVTAIFFIFSSFIGDGFAQDLVGGLENIGVGYDLLKGNPDDGALNKGGVDPGIHLAHKIYKMTFKEGKTSVGKKVPDQTIYVPDTSCATKATNDMYYGTKSYQKKLGADVEVSASFGIPALASAEFSASAGYKKEESNSKIEKNVFMESWKICNYGSARYRDELNAKYDLTDGVIADGCKLGTGKSDDSHKNFISKWGTHIIIEAKLGTKNMERTKTSLGEVVSFAMKDVSGGVSAGGSYQGVGASLSVSASKLTKNAKFSSFAKGKKETLNRGSKDRPAPISMKLIGIHSIFVPHFWKNAPCKPSDATITKIQANVKKALENYNIFLNVFPPTEDKNNLRVALTWPKGRYVLPETNKGCPQTSWAKGSRVQDTGNKNMFPSNNHWPTGTLSKAQITQSFCTKSNTKGTLLWPAGSYCIIKAKALSCPEGFDEGSISWDDKGSLSDNTAKIKGQMPSGDFGKNTKVDYCCREDSLASKAIFLPTDSPFYLMAKSNNCQKVDNLKVTPEVIQWDEESLMNKSDRSGSYPYDASVNAKGKHHKLTFCYYGKY